VHAKSADEFRLTLDLAIAQYVGPTSVYSQLIAERSPSPHEIRTTSLLADLRIGFRTQFVTR